MSSSKLFSKKKLPKSPGPMIEYNILMLSETGAGKSTTINAIANYLKFDNFEEAASSDFVHLIPSKFTWPNPKTGKPIVIDSARGILEEDEAARIKSGNSVTQSPTSYKFCIGNKIVIRLIDTPGMGDTSGAKSDKLNFEKILAYLNNLKNLHGICILLKTTETRKTASFRYCITELLTHLHKSACQNLMFCFTFGRNSNFGAGEGFGTLKDFLKTELKDVNYEPINGVNCFYIDNEAYRFLVAKKHGYPFEHNDEILNKLCWNKSVMQTQMMLDRIMALEPHKLSDTCSLNNARKLILELAQPMVNLQTQINANIAHIKAEEYRIKNSNETMEDLAKSLTLEVDDLEMRPLPHPVTVCTKCTEVVEYQGIQKVHYKTVCHDRCYLGGVAVSTVGLSILKDCRAINSVDGKCNNCGCSFNVHMHLTVEYSIVKRSIINANKQKEIANIEDACEKIEAGIKQMNQLVKELDEEVKVIQDVCSKFAYILISNANTPYNRFVEPYFNLLMDEEQKKMASIDGYPRTTFDSLVAMMNAHRESVRILTKAIKNHSHENVCIEDIYKYRNQLLALKHSGPQFAQMLNVTLEAKAAEFANIDGPSLDFNKDSSFLGKIKKIFWPWGRKSSSAPEAVTSETGDKTNEHLK